MNDLGFDLKDWEEAEAVEMGDFESLELGGHEIVILGAKLHVNEQTGNKSIKIIFDIAGNDKQAGFFKKQYDKNITSEAKWPVGGTKYMSTKKDYLQYLKGLANTILPNSNPGFRFDTNKPWDQIKGLKCAGEFGLEEYRDDKGNVRAGVRLNKFRSLNKLSEIKIPQVKLIDNQGSVPYEEYQSRKNNNNSSSTQATNTISDADLPF